MFLYVYMHVDPRNDIVKYVGVGPLSRAYDFNTRSAPHLEWLAELDRADLEPRIALPARTRDRAEALEIERLLIKFHRHEGSEIFNTFDLGVPEDVRAKISNAHRAKWEEPEFRLRRLPNLSAARAAKNRTPDHIVKITKHGKINGSPCKRCGGTLRYKISRNCVSCAKVVDSFETYAYVSQTVLAVPAY